MTVPIDEVLQHLSNCPNCRIVEGSPLLICVECHSVNYERGDKIYRVICEEVSGGYAICQHCLDEFKKRNQDDFRKDLQKFIERLKHEMRTK